MTKHTATAMMPSKDNDDLAIQLAKVTLKNTEAIHGLQQIYQLIDKKVDHSIDDAKQEIKSYVDDVKDDLTRYYTINRGEAHKLSDVIKSRATEATKTYIELRFHRENYGGQEFFSKKYGHIIRNFYHQLKEAFDVNAYTEIRHGDYQEAMKFTRQLSYRSLPKQTKRITDAQLTALNAWEKRHGLKLTEPED